MDVSLQSNAPLPPPSTAAQPAPVYTPQMPPAQSNLVPARAEKQSTAAQTGRSAKLARQRRPRSRTRLYGIFAALFLAVSVAGYIGFREYIYGDDAPPVFDLNGD